MIALYLIAAHMTGDFLLQTRWQATSKFDDLSSRAWHVLTYTACFVPIAVVYRWHWTSSVTFLAALAVLHFATDSRRFLSTPGDVIQWRLDLHRDPELCTTIWLEQRIREAIAVPSADAISQVRETLVADREALRWPPPNPWPAMPLMIDQTLHVIQIAVLAGLLLR